MLLALTALPLIGMGVMAIEVDGKPWTILIPFVLLAFMSFAVVSWGWTAAENARSAASPPLEPVPSEPYWPRTRLARAGYTMLLFALPIALIAAIVFSAAEGHWVTAGVFLAMTIAPTLIRIAIWRARPTRKSLDR